MTTTSTRWQTLGRAALVLWRGLDLARRALLNLLLLVALGLLLWLALRAGGPGIQPDTTLVLALQGPLVEQQPAAGVRQRLMGALQGNEGGRATRVRDVTAALDAAARDARIKQVLLVLDDFGGGSLPALREVAQAITRLRAAGKPVLAWGSGYDQPHWFLAAHAEQVWLHPDGAVWVEGFGRRRTHWRGLLERAGIDAHVLRAGRYKNAMEPYAQRGPSAETLESEGLLWQTMWRSYTGAVEKARRLEPGSVARTIDSLPASLQAEGGDMARWALKQRWVDRLLTRDELRAEMIRRGVADDGQGALQSFRQIDLGAYLMQMDAPGERDAAIGVIVAQGPIRDGRSGPGAVGGLSTAELVRQARADKHIKALVLRVDSPGGSAFGSELVRRELALTREAGKPVVVSMGGLAASGGYWISMAADEVIADEATITGSIGVVGLLPSAAGLLERLDVHAEGVTTTWLRGAEDPRRRPDPRFVTLVQSSIDSAYQQFITLVAKARGRSEAQVHALAQGRVWSGRDALALGLVDRIGGLEDAVAAAARRAQLEGTPQRRYLEAPQGRLDRWLDRLGSAAVNWLGAGEPAAATPLGHWLGPLTAEIAGLPELLALSRHATGGPAALAHCLCEGP